MDEDRAYEKAKERVEEKMGFISHLAAYIIVNAFLFFIDYRTDRVIDWAYWPLIGWGIGLLFHALYTFLFGEASDWKERMIRREMDKEMSRGGSGEMPRETPGVESGEGAGKE